MTPACTRKTVYPSDADAKRAITKRLFLDPSLPVLHYYRCPVCHHFHLTRTPQPAPPAGPPT